MHVYSTSAETGRPQALTQSSSAATPVSSVGQADTQSSHGKQVTFCVQAFAATLQLRSEH